MKGKSDGDLRLDANLKVEAPKLGSTSSPKVGGKVGGEVTFSAKGDMEAGGKGGFGIKMPKFGKGSRDSSSSSEDDGHGNRVKKVKATLPKPDLSIAGKVDSPQVGAKIGIKGGRIFPSPLRSS